MIWDFKVHKKIKPRIIFCLRRKMIERTQQLVLSIFLVASSLFLKFKRLAIFDSKRRGENRTHEEQNNTTKMK